MRAVVTRVASAAVRVERDVVGRIDSGLLALVGVTHSDGVAQVATLARKLPELRVLRGERCVLDEPAGAILVVSQFTLYGDVRRGRRPSWSAAAPSAQASDLIADLIDQLRGRGVRVETGVFGADMQVESINDGPVTLIIEA